MCVKVCKGLCNAVCHACFHNLPNFDTFHWVFQEVGRENFTFCLTKFRLLTVYRPLHKQRGIIINVPHFYRVSTNFHPSTNWILWHFCLGFSFFFYGILCCHSVSFLPGGAFILIARQYCPNSIYYTSYNIYLYIPYLIYISAYVCCVLYPVINSVN